MGGCMGGMGSMGSMGGMGGMSGGSNMGAMAPGSAPNMQKQDDAADWKKKGYDKPFVDYTKDNNWKDWSKDGGYGNKDGGSWKDKGDWNQGNQGQKKEWVDYTKDLNWVDYTK